MNNKPDDLIPDINPTTGLPLIDETYVDVGGNPYGYYDIYQPQWTPQPTSVPYWPPAEGELW